MLRKALIDDDPGNQAGVVNHIEVTALARQRACKRRIEAGNRALGIAQEGMKHAIDGKIRPCDCAFPYVSAPEKRRKTSL